MYDHHFNNFGRPPVPDDLCTDSAPRHPLFWRRLSKVFTIYYGHGGHLGQWTATILAIFHSPNLKGGSAWNLSNTGPEASEEVIWNSQHLSHTNVRYPYKCIGKQTWPRRKKVTHQCTTIILATSVDLWSPMICAKFQPQGILGSGEDYF